MARPHHAHPYTVTTTPEGHECDWTHPSTCPDGQACDILRRTHRMGIENMGELGTNRPDGTYNLGMFGFHGLEFVDNDGRPLPEAPPATHTPASEPQEQLDTAKEAAEPGNPNSCHWCSIDQRTHGRQYTEEAGWHSYVPPTSAQIKSRMLARRSPTA
ncbi:hypothetical protein [Streptomyces sp. NPDC006551]|uniref:hypothetical protein n=1 Tax=Streptomyces sp. NPDC006551 TaxID=3157178 RepID=UPI0033AD4A65